MRSSHASKLLLCLLVLIGQPVGAVREKTRALATGVSSASTNAFAMVCSAKMPQINMKVCMRLSTSPPGEPGPLARFGKWVKAKVFGPPVDPIEEAKKFITESGGRVLEIPQLLDSSKIGSINMEQGLLGCKDCAIKGCTQQENCKKDPSSADAEMYDYTELFKASSAVGSKAEDILSPKCFDLLKLLTFGGIDKTVTARLKQSSAVFEGKYCTYMGKHDAGEEMSLPSFDENFPYAHVGSGKTIAFPSENVCIDHLLSIKIGYSELTLPPKSFVPPTPVICWRLEDVKKNGFSKIPEVPWVSDDYKEIDGLKDVLKAGGWDDIVFDEKLKIAKAWCTKNEAKSAIDIVEFEVIDDFVATLTDATITQRKLRKKLEELAKESKLDGDEDAHNK